MTTHYDAIIIGTGQSGPPLAERMNRESLKLPTIDRNKYAKPYRNQGRYDEAETLYREALETQKRVLGDDHPETLWSIYGLGCVEALRGDRNAALEWLRQTVERGFTDADWMAKDSDLESLHGDPAFEALVERARENAAKQPANAKP